MPLIILFNVRSPLGLEIKQKPGTVSPISNAIATGKFECMSNLPKYVSRNSLIGSSPYLHLQFAELKPCTFYVFFCCKIKLEVHKMGKL